MADTEIEVGNAPYVAFARTLGLTPASLIKALTDLVARNPDLDVADREIGILSTENAYVVLPIDAVPTFMPGSRLILTDAPVGAGRGVDIEIIERVEPGMKKVIDEVGIIKPNAVRINGVDVSGPANRNIEIRGVGDKHEVPTVTVTLYIRSLSLGVAE